MPPQMGEELAGSFEIWLWPRRIWDKGTFLASYSPATSTQLLLRQSQTDIEIQTSQSDQWRPRTEQLYVKNVFRKSRPAFITITSGEHGTAVYVDGVLFSTAMRFRLPGRYFAGRLIAGNAPEQPDSWQGRLFGIAVYHRELNQAEVVRHYSAWAQTGRPAIVGDEQSVALYLFNEGNGNVAHNFAGPSLDLEIPAKYAVLDKKFLEPFWEEFNLSWSYWSAVLKNIVGFIPLGFCFYDYLLRLRTKRPQVLTIILGTVISVTIEVLQVYLPTRDSGMTDIFTNTLGTWMGIASYKLVGAILARSSAWADFVVPARWDG